MSTEKQNENENGRNNIPHVYQQDDTSYNRNMSNNSSNGMDHHYNGVMSDTNLHNHNNNNNSSINDSQSNKRMKLSKPRPVPKFLMKLFHMLSEGGEDTRKVVSWLPEDDTCFVVKDWTALSRDILPKYFASSTESFKRQLNYYGFHKCYDHGTKPAILLAEEKNANSTNQSSSVIYRHEDGLFVKDKPEFLSKIKRSTSSTANINSKLSNFDHEFLHASLMMPHHPNTSENFPYTALPGNGTFSRDSSSTENDLLRRHVHILQNDVLMLRERLNDMQTRMEHFETYIGTQLQQNQHQQFQHQNDNSISVRNNPQSSHNVNAAVSLQALLNQQHQQNALLRQSSMRSVQGVGYSNNVVGMNGVLPFSHQSSLINISGNGFPTLPRSQSLNGGVDRLNTGESTSSTNWAMLQEVLANENQMAGSHDSNHKQHLRRDSFHNPFAIGPLRKDVDNDQGDRSSSR